MSKYGDIPENPNMSTSIKDKNKVMHAQVMLTDEGAISGSDSLEPIESDQSVFIQAHLSEEKTAKKVFSELSDNGVVLAELAVNPPPDNYGISGCVKDKYGITWIILAVISD